MVLAVSVTVSLALHDIYFIDLLPGALLFGYSVYVFFWQAIPALSLAVAIPVAVYAFSRVAIVFFEPMRE